MRWRHLGLELPRFWFPDQDLILEHALLDRISRRSFTTLTAGMVLGSSANVAKAADKPKADPPIVPNSPTEAAFE